MITVHWSTHDLDDYYAQIKQIPRLSKEEQQQLVTLLAHSEQGQSTHSPDILQTVRHRLMEGHLRPAAAIAVRECPRERYRLLPELVEAANLALVEAMGRCDVQHPADLTSYLLTTVRGMIRRVLANENLIRVPDTTRQHARANGTAERFTVFATASLDVLTHPFDDDGEREPCAAPLLPTEAAPERDPALRAQVEAWLALLSPRAQTVLRLRYGLSDDNERAHSLTEVARLLGLP
jgi:RNA polymerase sigma factor (sigma-70 family)